MALSFDKPWVKSSMIFCHKFQLLQYFCPKFDIRLFAAFPRNTGHTVFRTSSNSHFGMTFARSLWVPENMVLKTLEILNMTAVNRVKNQAKGSMHSTTKATIIPSVKATLLSNLGRHASKKRAFYWRRLNCSPYKQSQTGGKERERKKQSRKRNLAVVVVGDPRLSPLQKSQLPLLFFYSAAAGNTGKRRRRRRIAAAASFATQRWMRTFSCPRRARAELMNERRRHGGGAEVSAGFDKATDE